MSFRKSFISLIDDVTKDNFLLITKNDLLTIIILTFLTFDVFLKFKTTFYERGVEIIDERKIVFNYFKKGLLIDLISIFPIYLDFFVNVEELDGGLMLTIINILRCFLLVKISDVNKCLTFIQEIFHVTDKQLAIFNLFELILSIFFFCHLMACGWHAISYYSPYETSILKTSTYKSDDWLTRYYTCLFFTANAGKIDPKNKIELVYAFFAILSTSGSIGFMVGGIHNIMRIISKSKDQQR